MAKLFHPKFVTYTLSDGSARTPDGKRVTKTTPGAVRTAGEAKKWYAWIGGKRVPLSESLDTAKRMLRLKTGQAEVTASLPPEARRLVEAGPQLQRKLTEHLADYRAYLEAQNNSAGYVSKTIGRCEAILEGCKWQYLNDFDPNAVLQYLHARRKKDTGANRYGFGRSTSNHYIGSIKGFARWLVRSIAEKTRQSLGDPLVTLRKLPAKEDDLRTRRRCLTDDEFAALLAAARVGATRRLLSGPDREALYLVAAYTGYRASELASLTPRSFRFGKEPTVSVEAGDTKNGKAAELPLQDDVANLMRTFISARPKDAPLWPANEAHPHESWHKHAADMLRRDLKAARAAWIEASVGEERQRREQSDHLKFADASGCVFDFHALRVQFITGLARAGVEVSVAQKLARHCSPVLTANVYTKLRLHDLGAAVNKLPGPRPAAAPLSVSCCPVGESEIPGDTVKIGTDLGDRVGNPVADAS